MKKTLKIPLVIVILLMAGCTQLTKNSFSAGQSFIGNKYEIQNVIGKTVAYKFEHHATMIMRHELDSDKGKIKLQGIFKREGSGFSDLHLQYILIGSDKNIIETVTLRKIPGIMHGDTFKFEHVFPYDSNCKYFSSRINATWY